MGGEAFHEGVYHSAKLVAVFSRGVVKFFYDHKDIIECSTVPAFISKAQDGVGAEKVAEFCIVEKGGNLLDLAFIACPTQAAINMPVGKTPELVRLVSHSAEVSRSGEWCRLPFYAA